MFNSQSEIINLYQDRIGDSEQGENTVGGRSQKWELAVKSIVTDPWGWDLSRFGYAHNLWLDVARVSGIFALIPLVLFSVSSIKLFLMSFKRLKQESFLRIFTFVFFIGIGLVFFVEPIMDGMYLLFFTFCLFVGFLAGIMPLNNRVGVK